MIINFSQYLQIIETLKSFPNIKIYQYKSNISSINVLEEDISNRYILAKVDFDHFHKYHIQRKRSSASRLRRRTICQQEERIRHTKDVIVINFSSLGSAIINGLVGAIPIVALQALNWVNASIGLISFLYSLSRICHKISFDTILYFSYLSYYGKNHELPQSYKEFSKLFNKFKEEVTGKLGDNTIKCHFDYCYHELISHHLLYQRKQKYYLAKTLTLTRRLIRFD